VWQTGLMKPATCLFLFSVCALAQNDGITTFASRTLYVQPDQVEATISLTTPATVTQQQAANVLQNAGLGSRLLSASTADLGVVGRALDRGNPSFLYSFSYSVAGSDMRDLVKKLETLQNARSTDYTSLNYSTTLSVSQALADEQFQRVLPQMLSDARKRAEVLASAAGLRVGAVQTISQTQSGVIGGVVSAISGFTSIGTAQPPALTFTVAVKFAVN
jgi:hypothetical protein